MNDMPHPLTARLASAAFAPRALRFLLVLLVAGSLAACSAGAPRAEDTELRFWLENKVHHHGYSEEEVAFVVDLDDAAVRTLYESVRDAPDPNGETADPSRPLVLPYPGGRHPRIGFLDGAIDPHRDTKASVFTPWSGCGFVVVDLPEAVWGNDRLQYLAHTHIPTVWDDRGVELERLEWTRETDGSLSERRVLPDGVSFRTRVMPREKDVDLLLEIHNGSGEPLAGVRAQVCVLLKGAPPFSAQTLENKVALDDCMAVRDATGGRWIAVAWERGKAWGNERCPCLHSDPVFGDLAPGEGAVRHGRLFFHEGTDIAAEVERRRHTGELLPAPELPAPAEGTTP